MVTAVVPANGPTEPLALVTFLGAGFGPLAARNLDAAVGGVACQTVSWSSSSALVCRNNRGTGGMNAAATMEVGLRTADPLFGFTYDGLRSIFPA